VPTACVASILNPVSLLTSKNLVARGEHQKPVAGGSGSATATEASYDNANHLSNAMDPSAEGPSDFGYPGSHVGSGEY